MDKYKIITKQKVITNTVIFIVVMAFILAFKAVFGTENTLIGVSTITATLMLLGRDFTGQPLKKYLNVFRDKPINGGRNCYCRYEYMDSYTYKLYSSIFI